MQSTSALTPDGGVNNGAAALSHGDCPRVPSLSVSNSHNSELGIGILDRLAWYFESLT